jgi:hypothetical protein
VEYPSLGVEKSRVDGADSGRGQVELGDVGRDQTLQERQDIRAAKSYQRPRLQQGNMERFGFVNRRRNMEWSRGNERLLGMCARKMAKGKNISSRTNAAYEPPLGAGEERHAKVYATRSRSVLGLREDSTSTCIDAMRQANRAPSLRTLPQIGGT